MTKTEFWDELIKPMIVPYPDAPENTDAPFEITRLQSEPREPTIKFPTDVRLELVSVTIKELLEPALPLRITCPPANTVPPFEMAREFEEPKIPTSRVPELLQVEPTPVTKTELLEAEEFFPITPVEFAIVPPLLITSVFPLPS